MTIRRPRTRAGANNKMRQSLSHTQAALLSVFSLALALIAAPAHAANEWAPLATISGTTTLVTNSLCYTDGLDILCNGSGPAASGNLPETISLTDLKDGLVSSSNVFLGPNTGRAAATGNMNLGFGYYTLAALTTGELNAGFGTFALGSNTTGSSNMAVGFGALSKNTIGSYNVAMGVNALAAVTSGSNNFGLGANSLPNLADGAGNIAIGNNAGGFVSGTSSVNIFIGDNTGRGTNNASFNHKNTVIGGYAGQSLSTGSSNTLIGYNSGAGITSGERNLVLGAQTTPYSNTGSNQLNIANAIWGNFGSGLGNANLIGINVASPTASLEVSGTISTTALTVNGVNIAAGASYVGLADVVVSSTTGNLSGPTSISGFTSSDVTTTTAFGIAALGSGNNTGYANSAFGASALLANTSGNNNTATGHFALGATTTGRENTAIGAQALAANVTGLENTAIGSLALRYNTGSYNIAIGRATMFKNTTGSQNTAVNGMFENLTGAQNTSVGFSSLNQNVGGSYNAALGHSALNNPKGSQNTAVGAQSLFQGAGVTNTVAIGFAAGRGTDNNSTYQAGTFVGALAGNLITTGSNNTFVGYNAGAAVTSGAGNLVLGAQTTPYSNTGSNQLNIANAIWGNFGSGLGNANLIGINVASPTTALQVSGTISATQFVGDGSLLTNMPAGAINTGVSGSLVFRDELGNLKANNTITVSSTQGSIGIGAAVPTTLGSNALYTLGSVFGTGGLTTNGMLTFNGNGRIRWDNNNTSINGTNSGGYLSFTTSATEAMRIISNSYVGIGTTTPSSELQVSGTVTATRFVGDGSLLTNLTTNGERIISGTTQAIAYNNTSLSLVTAGTERVVVGTTGNVGIAQQPGTDTVGISGTVVAQSTQDASVALLNASNPSSGANAIANLNVRSNSAVATLSVWSSGKVYNPFNSYSRPDGVSLFTNAASTGGLALAARATEGILTLHTGGNFERVRISARGLVGIGTTTPTTSLDISGSVRVGVETSTTLQTCDTDRTGAIRYTGGDFQFCRNGTSWEALTSLASSGATAFASLTDVSYSTAGANIFGPSSKVGAIAGMSDTTALGYNALSSTSNNGSGNTAFGSKALTGGSNVAQNTAVGAYALTGDVSNAVGNTAVGYLAMPNNLGDSNYNTSLGYRTLGELSGNGNLALGAFAMQSATGDYNIAIGYESQKTNSITSNNIGIGYQALYNVAGNNNLAIGTEALKANTSAVNNVAIGYRALQTKINGNNNVALGYQAANTLTSGTNNIFIGASTTPFSTTGSNQLNIGNALYGNIGSGSSLANRLGINVTSPTVALQVSGTVTATRFTGDGSGLTNLSSGDRLISGTTQVIAYNNTSTSIATAGVERVVIGANGRVGIGQQPGAETLSVSSTVRVGENLIDGSTAGTNRMEIGYGVSTPKDAYVDLIADTTYPDFGMRLWRTGGGENLLIARSTNGLELMTEDAGPIKFTTTSSERMRLTPTGELGIGTTTPGAYKLYVAGDAYSTGTWGTSDGRFKENVHAMSGLLNQVDKLRPVTFTWKKDAFPAKDNPGEQIGLIAQEVEKVYPEMVKTNTDGYKAVAYDKLSVLLLGAVKELKADNDQLRTENAAILKRLDALEQRK